MHIAIVVGLGSAGGSRQPLAWQHQMAALALPYGKSDSITGPQWCTAGIAELCG